MLGNAGETPQGDLRQQSSQCRPIRRGILHRLAILGCLVFAAIAGMTLLAVSSWTPGNATREAAVARSESLIAGVAADLREGGWPPAPFSLKEALADRVASFPEVVHLAVRASPGDVLAEVWHDGLRQSGTDAQIHTLVTRVVELPEPVIVSVAVPMAHTASASGVVLGGLDWRRLIGMAAVALAVLCCLLASPSAPFGLGFDKVFGFRAGAARGEVPRGDGRLLVLKKRRAARRSLVESIVRAQEEERKLIARNLHDEIGASLSHLLISVQGMCQPCEKTTQLSNDLRLLIDETRRLAWDFRPGVLDDFGLESALKPLLEKHCSRLGIEVDCECVDFSPANPPGARLPGEVEVTLYRIAQEAVTNIVRHSGARNVSVVLLKKRDHATLIIEDDGCGFDMASLPADGKEGHLGLISMNERAQLLGGTVVIDSLPGRGTTVRATIHFQQVAQ